MSTFSVFKKAIFFFKPFRAPFLVLMFLMFLQTVLYTTSNYFLGLTVDSLTENNIKMATIIFAIYLFMQVFPEVVSRFKLIYQLKKVDFSFLHFVERETLNRSLSLSLGQLRKEHSGFKQDVILSGERGFEFLMYVFIDDILPIATNILVAFIGLFFIAKPLFWVSVVALILYVSFNYVSNNLMKVPLQQAIRRKVAKSKNFLDLLQNLFFIKFNNQKTTARNQHKQFQNRYENYTVKIWTKYHTRMIVSDIISILYILAIGYFAFTGVINETISIGMLIPIVVWSASISWQLSRVRSIHRRTTISIADLKKMFNMLEQESDVPIAEDAKRIKEFNEDIVFENVSFDYQDGKKGALLDVDVEIKKDEKVALVGKSGSGKSTIVSMLLRLYDPSFGSLLIDGKDLRSLELSDWHNMIAYVPQDSDLLDISIKENVLFGAKTKSSNTRIEEALKQAEAYDFVSQMPEGINTIVGERGVKLSGGQKQRICIARALVKDSPILILDEATSSLDSETEKFLNKNIWDILKGKTGIVIAHRLSTILDADKIIVTDEGQIVGVGTHEELLKTCKFYKKLVDAQNISF